MKVIFYSTHCPKCRVVEMKLKQKGIEYEERDDVEEMKSLGIKSAPYIKVDNILMDFSEAIKWVNERA